MPHSWLHALSFSPRGLCIHTMGVILDAFKSTLSLNHIIACLFLMEGKSCPGNGNSQSWVWLYQGLVSFTMSQCHNVPRNELSHHYFPDFGGQLAFPWVLQEEERHTLVLFIFNKEIHSSDRTDYPVCIWMSVNKERKGPFPWSFSSWTSTAAWMRVLSSEQKCIRWLSRPFQT